MFVRKAILSLIVLFALLCMKRKSADTRNETRKLKRRAQALLKKNLAKAKAECERLENLRNKKAKKQIEKVSRKYKGQVSDLFHPIENLDSRFLNRFKISKKNSFSPFFNVNLFLQA